MYDDFVQEIVEGLEKRGTADHGANQLLTMHGEAAARKDPVILELGTANGISTRAFLNAVHKGVGGHLVSVDIADCSHVAESSRWKFVQSDSSDVEGILSTAPLLRDGIDILYIDSLHQVDHVRKELFGFFPYVKDGGVIFFDDVDSIPYMDGQPKDNIKIEVENQAILNLVTNTFLANQDKLYFTFFRGSTGLCRLQKRGGIGDTLSGGPYPRPRGNRLYWKLRKSANKRLAKIGINLPWPHRHRN